MNSSLSNSFLHRVLKLQAVTEVVVGIATLAGAGWLAAVLQLPQVLLLSLGGLGLLFGVRIYQTVTRSPLQANAVWSIIGSNAIFAIVCAIALVGGWFDTNALGTAFIIANAIFSAALAEVEFIALRRMRGTVAAAA